MEGVLTFAADIVSRSPRPLVAVGVFFLGWFAALLARFALSRFLKLVRFDSVSEKTGFSEFLRKGSVSYTPSSLVGRIAFWIVLLAALFQVSRIMDISVVNAVFDQAMSWVPSFLAALFIAIIGSILVSFFANFAGTLAGNAALPNARLLVRLIKYGGNLIVVVIALDQVGFGRSIVNSMFLLLFAALSFGTALAFGLGCKDIARDAFLKFMRNLREREHRGTDLEG